MTSLRWYTAQLTGLPPQSKRQLTQKLMNLVRRGGLPTRREWKFTVQRSSGMSSTR